VRCFAFPRIISPAVLCQRPKIDAHSGVIRAVEGGRGAEQSPRSHQSIIPEVSSGSEEAAGI
jgi:hypothetical protein